ncbi:hypothetical protein Goklo_004382 [Gossypium klotzschianum]|uniref:Uncharacterized protein n=1 Tax=Gossypium klotzschianum TaxID=34286 RepID=A0A7J8VNI0_9ROSI|nr:hypothetical protein [Gossypium klotzschianum]
MTSLRHLDLSHNYFNSSIPEWLYNFSTLQVLRLYGNELQCDISSGIFNIRTLSELDLSWNDLEGKLPRVAGKLCKMRSIDLSGIRLNQDISQNFEILSVCSSPRLESLAFSSNSISGPIPTSLGQLANLEWVDISNNLLKGVVSEKHFANLTKLWDFRGSNGFKRQS